MLLTHNRPLPFHFPHNAHLLCVSAYPVKHTVRLVSLFAYHYLAFIRLPPARLNVFVRPECFRSQRLPVRLEHFPHARISIRPCLACRHLYNFYAPLVRDATTNNCVFSISTDHLELHSLIFKARCCEAAMSKVPGPVTRGR